MTCEGFTEFGRGISIEQKVSVAQKKGRSIWIGEGEHALDTFPPEDIVLEQELDPLSSGVHNALIPVCDKTIIPWIRVDSKSRITPLILTGNDERFVAATVIDDNNFDISETLSNGTIDTLREVSRAVERRNADADQWHRDAS
jgi:hypothetical protein